MDLAEPFRVLFDFVASRVGKMLDEFAVAESSVPRATFDDLASLEWIRPKENLVLLGPAGTGKSHTLIALGHAAVEAGFRVRYFAAASLAEALYREGGPARRHGAAGSAGRIAPRVTVEITEAGANHVAAWDIDQRVRAIHEAGGAVMAAALGMPVKAVDISGRHGGYRDPGLADDSLPDTTSEPRSPERFRRTAPMEALPPAPASPRAVWAIGMTVAAVRRREESTDARDVAAVECRTQVIQSGDRRSRGPRVPARPWNAERRPPRPIHPGHERPTDRRRTR